MKAQISVITRLSSLTRVAAVAASMWLAVCHAATPALAEPVRVAVTLDMIGQWVKQVGGDEVSISTLSPVGSDPHTFEPTARAINSARDAQAVFAMGLGLEPWLEQISRNDLALKIVSLAPQGGVIALEGTHAYSGCNHTEHAHAGADHGHSHAHSHQHSDGAAQAAVHTASAAPHRHDHDHNRSHDHGHTNDHNRAGSGSHSCNHHHGEADPHVWMDPILVGQMVGTIADTLSALRPQQAGLFAKNAQRYQVQLAALDSEIREALSAVPQENRKLVTNHDNLRYFAKRYGFEVVDTLFGVQGSEGGQPSARKVRELVSQLKAQDIRAVFADAYSNGNLLQTVAKEAGLGQPVTLYPLVGAAGSPAADYASMMRYNARQIAKALGSAQ